MSDYTLQHMPKSERRLIMEVGRGQTAVEPTMSGLSAEILRTPVGCRGVTMAEDPRRLRLTILIGLRLAWWTYAALGVLHWLAKRQAKRVMRRHAPAAVTFRVRAR